MFSIPCLNKIIEYTMPDTASITGISVIITVDPSIISGLNKNNIKAKFKNSFPQYILHVLMNNIKKQHKDKNMLSLNIWPSIKSINGR